MAGKTKIMSIVKQILLHHFQRRSKKSIVRVLNISKNTVGRYIQKHKAQGAVLKTCFNWMIKLLKAIRKKQFSFLHL